MGEPARDEASGAWEGLRCEGFWRPLGGAISAMREKIQWEWVDHSGLIKKLVREFREGDKALALERAIPIMRPGEGLRGLDSGAGQLAALDAGGVQPGRAACDGRVAARRSRCAWPGMTRCAS